MTGDSQHLSQIEQELGALLRRFRSYSARAAKEIDPDLEFGAYGLLVRIMETGPVRASDLAEYMVVGKPTVTRQLKALEDRGLLERVPNEHDARSSLVALTENGAERLRNVRAAGRQRLRESLSGWGEADIAGLADALSRLNESFSDLPVRG